MVQSNDRTQNIITIDGYDAIRKQFETLKKEKAHWVEEKRVAAAFGDRSENAEYQAAKENIRNIDKRLYKIDHILSVANVADTRKRKRSEIVLFGDTVKLEKLQGDISEELTVRIVGTNELQYLPQVQDVTYISNVSPLGRLLIGKEEGDVEEFNGIEYEILEIL